jgi:hypothetical protein
VPRDDGKRNILPEIFSIQTSNGAIDSAASSGWCSMQARRPLLAHAKPGLRVMRRHLRAQSQWVWVGHAATRQFILKTDPI